MLKTHRTTWGLQASISQSYLLFASKELSHHQACARHTTLGGKYFVFKLDSRVALSFRVQFLA
jgi:hypothetical protein